MKKLALILAILFTIFNLHSHKMWENVGQQRSLDFILSYAPGVTNYVYGEHPIENIIGNKNLQYSYYFSDSIQLAILYNFPVYEIGFIGNIEWIWGPRTFVCSALFRALGFNINIYNLVLRFSVMDTGFAVYKYGFLTDAKRFNQWCLYFAPVATSLGYTFPINDRINFLLDFGYSMRVIYKNDVYFDNAAYNVSLFLENIFHLGFGIGLNFSK